MTAEHPDRAGPFGRRVRHPPWAALATLALLLLAGAALPPAAHALAPPSLHGMAARPSNSASDALGAAVASLRSGAGPAGGVSADCGDSGGGSARCTFDVAHSPVVPAGRPAATTFGWRPVPVHPGAQGQGPVLLSYDSADRFILLLGTASGVASDNASDTQTWTFHAGRWTQEYPSASPAVCGSSAIADDPADSGVVYFAAAGCRASDTTWLFHGGTWTNQTTSVRPPPRSSATMTFDTADDYVVLFGGANPYGRAGSFYFNDTWGFSGGTWVNLTSTAGTAPAPRSDALQADDLGDGAVILWGGLGSGFFNDTWEFKSGKWSAVAAKGAPAFASYFIEARSAYDRADGYVLVVGAQNATRGPYEFAYRYSAGTWARVPFTGGPGDRNLPGMAYDGSDGEMVLFGGTNYAPQPGDAPQNDTWTYVRGNWTSWDGPGPGPRAAASLSYDAGDGYVVLFGGWVTPPFSSNSANQVAVNDTWKFQGGNWTQLHPARAPSPRYGAGLVDDLADGYLVLFGGSSTTTPFPTYRDTWEFLNGSWTPLSPSRSPPAQAQPALVYDGADGYALLYAATAPAETWAFHAGAWTNLTRTSGPRPGAPLNPLVYDAADGYVLLFGTATAAAPYMAPETWTYLNGNWTNRTAGSAGAPPITQEASLLDDPGPNGTVVMFTESGATWTYSAGSWTLAFPAVAPPGRAEGSTTYDGLDGYGLLFGGYNTSNWNAPGYTGAVCPGALLRPCGDAWAWTAGGATALRATLGIIPGSTDVGRTVNVVATASGGSAPYTYAYAGLPTGCASANRTTLNCTPTAAGTFTVVLTVSDAAGNHTSASAGLTVGAPPSITGFTASPSSIPVSGRTVLTVNATGGTLPWSFNFTGLPPGCVSQTVPSIPCYPSATGNYSVTARVMDAAGRSATATTRVTVVPAGGPGRPLVTAFGAQPSVFTLGNATNLTVNASGSGALTYSYAGLPTGCASTNASILTCRPATAGVYDIVLTVGETGGGNTTIGTNITVYPVGGGGAPSILAFITSPTAVVLGNATTLSVVARANATLSYRYAGLPPGCATGNTSTLTCTPTAAGSYRVQAIVSAPAANPVGVFGLMIVTPAVVAPLRVGAFVAAPANLTLGQTLALAVSAYGGVAPLQYAFAGLPPGCSSVDASSLSCVPAASGHFAVTVTITDAVSHQVQAVRAVDVLPNTAPPGGPGSGVTSAYDWFTAEGGALVVAIGFAFGLAVTALATEAVRRRRLAAEGQQLVQQMADEEGAVDDGPNP